MQRRNLHKYKDVAAVVAEGTGIGLFGRIATLSSEKIYYDYSSPTNTRSYAEITRYTFKPSVLWKLHTDVFFSSILIQTILKSGSNMGVIQYVDTYHGDLSPLKKGLRVSSISAPLETLGTSSGEYKKLHKFVGMQPGNTSFQMRGLLSPEFGYVFMATFARASISSVLTFCGIYQTQAMVKKVLPTSTSEKPIAKAAGAVLGTAAVQPLLMPTINFQNFAAQHPGSSFFKTLQAFYHQHTLKEMLRGTAGRTVNRVLYYGITFFVAEKIKEKKKQKLHELSTKTVSNAPQTAPSETQETQSLTNESSPKLK